MDHLKVKVAKWINNHQSEIEEDLITLLKFPSVYDEKTASPSNPYGEAISNTLDWFETKSRKNHFNPVKDANGQYLWLAKDGISEGRIDVVSHVDVVSVDASQWEYPPFSAQKVGSRIYARGAQDMKTQLWASYVALRILKELEIETQREIRVVIGTDEERTMKDMKLYIEDEGLPDFAFTPDGEFPVCLGEMGVYTMEITKNVSSAIQSIQTYQSSNVICDRVDLVLNEAAYSNQKIKEKLKDVPFKYDLNRNHLRIHGVAAHSSRPELGENALIHALDFIGHQLHEGWAQHLYTLFSDYRGRGIGLEPYYEPMGSPSVNATQCHLTEAGALKVLIDIRYPSPLDRLTFDSIFEEKLVPFEYKCVYDDPVTETNIDNPYVQQLLITSKRWLGDIGEPYYSGGVTYAKVFQGKCVAFGTHYLNDGVINRAHQANEYLDLNRLSEYIGIFAEAMIRLANNKGEDKI